MWIRLTEQEAAALKRVCTTHDLVPVADRIVQAEEWSKQYAAKIEEAENLYTDSSCDIEVDEHAAFSPGTNPDDPGVWVMGWLWVRDKEKEE